MARTTRVGKQAAAADDDRDDGTNDDIDALLESLGGEADHVVLWRVDGPKGKQEHVDKVPFSRFNAEYVAEKHGGGDYILRVYGPVKQGGGRNVVKYREFSIDRAIPPKSGAAFLEWQKQNGIKSAATTTAAPSDDKSNVWGMVLAATLPALATGLFQMLSKDKPAIDPTLAAILQKIINSDGSKGVDPVELQRLLADERERAYNHGKESAPRESNSDDPLAGVLGSTLPGLVDVFKESVANDRAKVEAMRARRQQAATVTATNAATAAGSGPAWLQLLRQYIPQLVGYMGQVEPGALAARVLENLPVKVYRDLAASCESETFVADTLAELGELTKTPERRAYFTALLTTVQDELAPAGELEEEPAGNGQPDGTAEVVE